MPGSHLAKNAKRQGLARPWRFAFPLGFARNSAFKQTIARILRDFRRAMAGSLSLVELDLW